MIHSRLLSEPKSINIGFLRAVYTTYNFLPQIPFVGALFEIAFFYDRGYSCLPESNKSYLLKRRMVTIGNAYYIARIILTFKEFYPIS